MMTNKRAGLGQGIQWQEAEPGKRSIVEIGPVAVLGADGRPVSGAVAWVYEKGTNNLIRTFDVELGRLHGTVGLPKSGVMVRFSRGDGAFLPVEREDLACNYGTKDEKTGEVMLTQKQCIFPPVFLLKPGETAPKLPPEAGASEGEGGLGTIPIILIAVGLFAVGYLIGRHIKQ